MIYRRHHLLKFAAAVGWADCPLSTVLSSMRVLAINLNTRCAEYPMRHRGVENRPETSPKALG